jgi:hypothetical protein
VGYKTADEQLEMQVVHGHERVLPAPVKTPPFLLQRYWIPACAGMTDYCCGYALTAEKGMSC